LRRLPPGVMVYAVSIFRGVSAVLFNGNWTAQQLKEF
jgi:hypothetical protein